MSGTVLNTLHVLIHFLFTTNCKIDIINFLYEKNELQRVYVTCPKSKPSKYCRYI